MAQAFLSNPKFKKAIGYSFIAYFTIMIQYHMIFFIQYFVLQFAYQSFNPIVATFLILLGLFLLGKMIVLFFVCSMKKGGPVKEVKNMLVDVQKMRVAEARKFEQYFTKQDILVLKSLNSDIQSIEARYIDNPDAMKLSGKLCNNVCNKFKPARAHHCRTCGDCVMRRDHHCIWLNNCIGINNYRFFV